MEDVWIEYIPWVYAAIQGAITLTVSIIGAKYVRSEFLKQKNRTEQHTELQIDITLNNSHNPQHAEEVELKETVEDDSKKQKEEIGQVYITNMLCAYLNLNKSYPRTTDNE